MAFWPFTQPWYDGPDDLRRRYAETVIYNDDYKVDFMAQKPTMEPQNGSHVKEEKDEIPHDACKDQDLIFKENSTSPLLQLPQELKNRIYELACGGSLLHISHRQPENKFHNYICAARVSDQQVYDDFRTAQGCWNPQISKINQPISNKILKFSPWKPSADIYQHDHCLELRTGGLLLGLPSLGLSLLRVCRQIHHEAHLVPISYNTFAFEDPHVLRRFIASISPAHRRAIRRVQLDVMLDSARMELAWLDAIFFVLVPRLRHLRSVDLCIDLADYRTLTPDDRVAEPRDDDDDGAWMAGLMCLRRLRLRNATVVIRDRETGVSAWLPDKRWPLEQKQRWAGFIRERILGLDGGVEDEDEDEGVDGEDGDEDSDEE